MAKTFEIGSVYALTNVWLYALKIWDDPHTWGAYYKKRISHSGLITVLDYKGPLVLNANPYWVLKILHEDSTYVCYVPVDEELCKDHFITVNKIC